MPVERPVHCTDSELLAYLDGELPWWRSFFVRRHLRGCWKCRGRVRSQEEQILHLTASMEAWEHRDALWHLDQQVELGLRLQRFEKTGRAGRSRRPHTRVWGLAMAAAAVLCAALILLPRHARTNDSDLPIRTVTGAQTFEGKLYHLPVEQTLAVRIEPASANRRAAAGQLHIWSDASQGRFASRWVAADGQLKLALWRPSPGREYMLRPRVSKAVLQRTSHAASDRIADFLTSGTSGDLEDAFMGWMESRSWAPVSFAPEAAQWMNGAGAHALAESVVAADGSRRIRITIERRMQASRAVLRAEFDAATFQPRRLSIRFESDGRSAELDMTAQRVRNVAPSEVSAAAVAPPSDESPERPASLMPSPEAPPLPSRLPVLAVDRVLIDSAERAAEAQFVLHVAGACLGESIVVEEVSGGVRVRSTKGAAGGWPEAASSSAKLADVLGALAALRDPAGGGLQQENSTFGSKAVMHARALRALAHQFPEHLSDALPKRSRHLLQLMLQNHIEGVRAGLPDLTTGATDAPSGEAVAWRDAAGRIYDALSEPAGESATPERMGRLLQALSESFAAENRRAVERAESRQDKE